jgi:hypothetical protein
MMYRGLIAIRVAYLGIRGSLETCQSIDRDLMLWVVWIVLPSQDHVCRRCECTNVVDMSVGISVVVQART